MGYLLDIAKRAAEAATVTPEHAKITARIAADDATARHWRFRVRDADGATVELRTLPEATLAEARALWPAGTVEPILDPVVHRRATPNEAREIRTRLATILGEFHREYEEAVAVAMRDPDAALDALRSDFAAHEPDSRAARECFEAVARIEGLAHTFREQQQEGAE